LEEIGTNEKLIKDTANIYMEDFHNIQPSNGLKKHAQESNKGAMSLPLHSMSSLIKI